MPPLSRSLASRLPKVCYCRELHLCSLATFSHTNHVSLRRVGARKVFSESLASFVQVIQQSPLLPQFQQFINKLELFRTETLTPLDPVDKSKQAANAVMDDILDSTVGVDNLVIPEIPISNTRAGLYVYLNASVSLHILNPLFLYDITCILTVCYQLVGRPLIDDHALFSYLNNRYQVFSPSYTQ